MTNLRVYQDRPTTPAQCAQLCLRGARKRQAECTCERWRSTVHIYRRLEPVRIRAILGFKSAKGVRRVGITGNSWSYSDLLRGRGVSGERKMRKGWERQKTSRAEKCPGAPGRPFVLALGTVRVYTPVQLPNAKLVLDAARLCYGEKEGRGN